MESVKSFIFIVYSSVTAALQEVKSIQTYHQKKV